MLEAGITLIVLLVMFLFFLLIFRPIRVVKDYERLVLFRLGRFAGTRGPGLVWLWPVIDQVSKVNLREDFLEIPSQTCITQDNAPIDIDFLIYWKVVDPGLSVLKVRDFAGASQGIATTTLRAVIGDIPLDDVLAKREQINQVLRAKLDEVTERWGVKVTGVEIREIVPPRDIQQAMNRQMSAERERRAVVLEADGKKQASITVAEGNKQAAILQAEGARQSRRVFHRAVPHLRDRAHARPEDHAASVPGHAAEARGGAGDEVHLPDGVQQPGLRVREGERRGWGRGLKGTQMTQIGRVHQDRANPPRLRHRR